MKRKLAFQFSINLQRSLFSSMSIARKVRSVERLFNQTDSDLQRFREQSRLSCLAGCGVCCTKTDIEATALEFLPFAFHCFREGRAYTMLEQLREHPTSICHLYRLSVAGLTGKGNCSEYLYRGLICRLFGFSASRNKHGKPVLATCTVIKESQKENYLETVENVRQELIRPPIISHYYSRLAQIDPQLGTKLYPINEAIKKAIEAVLHYYAYRRPPKRLGRAA